MRNEDGGRSTAPELLNPREALLLKRRVPDREHLVDQQDIGVQVCRNRKSDPHVHSRRVPFDRNIDERSDAGEFHDPIELGGDFPARHTEYGAAQIYILPSCQLWMEPGAELDER